MQHEVTLVFIVFLMFKSFLLLISWISQKVFGTSEGEKNHLDTWVSDSETCFQMPWLVTIGFFRLFIQEGLAGCLVYGKERRAGGKSNFLLLRTRRPQANW